MSRDYLYYVVIVPKKENEFRPCILEYGISYEQASEKVRWYINDHGLMFKHNGKHYRALLQIKRISETLPDGYFLFTMEEAKK